MLEKDYKIEIGKVSRVRSIAVAPVYARDMFKEKVILLDSAMQNEKFSIKEPDSIENLIIHNDLNDKVFVPSGMVIEGISQNRYSIYPCLVMPHTANLELPVNCAQEYQGFRSGRFDGATTIMAPSIRDVNQHEAWNSIYNTTRILKRMDPTRSYVFAEKNANINEYLEAIGNPKVDQIGLVAGIKSGDRTFYYTDFFGNNSILREVHSKLAKSFGIVGKVHEGNAETITTDGLVAFLRKIEVVNGHKKEHVGGGELFVLNNPVSGSALVYENDPVQISMRQDHE